MTMTTVAALAAWSGIQGVGAIPSEGADVSCDSRQLQPADRARAALAEAEQAVLAAREQQALWTTAEEALKLARRALERGNYAEALKQAKTAREHAELGLAQKSYPLFPR